MSERKNIPELRFPEFDGGWERKKIIDFAPLQRGFDLPVDKIREGKYPVVFSNGILKYHDEYKVKGPGVVTGRSGTIGKVTYVEDNFWAHNTSLWVTNFNGNHTKFVYYFYYRYKLKNFATGSGVPTLNRNDIHSQKECFPSLPEQQKIASFFTAIDQKISQLKQKKTLLEQYKKGVMQGLFNQDPGKGLNHDSPDFQDEKDLKSRKSHQSQKSRFRLRFRDENGQEFPKWEKKKFNEVYSFKTTNSFSRDNLNYDSGEIRNIHYGDIHTKYPTLLDITQHDVPYINSYISITKIKKDSYCIKNDLIFADASEDVPDVGKCIELINLNEEKVLAGLHTILARPDKTKTVSGFGGYLMASNGIRKQIMKISQGSKVTSISSSRLGEIEIDLPCPEEQSNIAMFLLAIDNKINYTQTQIENAERWKKGLLQKMFV